MTRLITAILLLFPFAGFGAELIFDVGIQIENSGDEIMTIGVFAETDETNKLKSIYVDTSEKRFELTLSQIASGKPTLISYRGIQMATIQGLSKTKTGEGWIRITPPTKRVAKNANSRARNIDVYLLPSEAPSYWKAIYNQDGNLRLISEANLILDKNPFQMGWTEILLSPPKIIDLSPKVSTCESGHRGTRAMREGFFHLGLKRGLEFLGCNIRELQPEAIIDMMISLNSHPYYLNYVEDSVAWFSPHSYGLKLPKKPKERNYWKKLEQFRTVVFDFSKPENQRLLPLDSLFSYLIETGELETIEYLFTLGVFPNSTDQLLPAAIAQLYQFSLFTEKLSIPERSQKIYELIFSKTQAGTTLDLSVLVEELAKVANASIKVNFSENSPALNYLANTLEFAKASGLFTFDSTQKYVAEEMVVDLSMNWVNDRGESYLNDSDLQTLIKQLKNWNQ